jgi:PiT family inorganic phosphate transporter
MSEAVLPGSIEPAAHKGPDLSGAINPITGIIFGGVIAAVLLFVAYSIWTDVSALRRWRRFFCFSLPC